MGQVSRPIIDVSDATALRTADGFARVDIAHDPIAPGVRAMRTLVRVDSPFQSEPMWSLGVDLPAWVADRPDAVERIVRAIVDAVERER